MISYCIFDNNSAPDDGGGICGVSNSNIEINDCVLLNNVAGDTGGGLRTHSSTIFVTDSSIHDNVAYDNGGGFHLDYSECSVFHSVFYDNTAYEGSAAIDIWSGIAVVQNCTITQNISNSWAGGIGMWDTANVDILNTIISFNQGSGLVGHQNSFSHISYCDIYSNSAGDFQGYFTQDNLGTIQGQNYNGDPCDLYSNIFLNPEFCDPDNYDFQLTEDSACINAGSPLLPEDPDGSISDIGAFHFSQVIPIADFTADLTLGIVPLNVNFSDQSSLGVSGNPIIEWNWDFDNNGTIDSYEQNPTYLYTEAGTFTVSLEISDGEYTNLETKMNFITVIPAVEAEFEANPLEGYSPLEVQFSDLSTGSPISWSWDFNNDEIIDSFEQNPVFVYNHAGIYSVSMTVGDGVHTDIETKTAYILVFEPVEAEFEGSPTEGQFPLTVQFTDLSAGNPTIWLWDFDNDGFADSNDQNPSYTYNTAGLYTVSLAISDGNQSSVETKIDYITVNLTDANIDIIPLHTKLFNSYPNPFNPSTTIRYDLSEPAEIEIQVLNNKGQIVRTLVDQNRTAGHYTVIWNGDNDSGKISGSGIYFYNMIINGRINAVKKCILLK